MDIRNRSHSGTSVSVSRTLRVQAAATFPILLALGLLLAWGGRDVSFVGTPPVVDKAAQVRVATEAIVAEQVAALGCDKVQRLSERVAVTPYPVEGEHVFDTAVVSVVPFDEAWAQAKAGRAVVQGWCD